MFYAAHLLVVDDDTDNAANLTDILHDEGYRVDKAHDGNEALRLVSENEYDAVLVDFKMPDMDGATLLAEIRSIRPNLTAIMVTAYASNREIERAHDAGVWKVMKKPVDIRAMLNSVQEALGSAPNQPENDS